MVLANVTGDSLADLPPTTKIPLIWEAAALGGLYRMHAAQVVFKKHAGSLFILCEGES